MPFRGSPMTRTRTTHPRRNSFQNASCGKNLLTRHVLLSFFHDQRNSPLESMFDPLAAPSLPSDAPFDSKHQMAWNRLMFRLAVRLGRSFSARAAGAPARRIGISVWRSDFWVKPVRLH